MKKEMLIVLLFSLSVTGVLQAQVVDDLYYDPEKARTTVASKSPEKAGYGDDYYEDGGAAVYEDEYDYYNDYDYYYTSRIRRFHRPYYGFNYFDPIYVDAYHYDRFLAPGMTMLIYDDYYSNRFASSFNRWNRWNSWGYTPGLTINIFNNYNSFGYRAWDPWYGSGFNTWNRWNSWNSWGYGGPYMYSSAFGYYPPSWGNGYQYNTIGNTVDDNTHFGPRTGGSATGPAPGARPGRAPGITDNSPGASPRTINNAGGRLTESERTRIPVNPGTTPERISPQTREYNRYPTSTPRPTETPRNLGNDRAVPTDRNISNPGTRVSPSTRTTTPSSNNIYNRQGSSSAPSPSAAPRTYSPSTRSYDRSGSSYNQPTTPSSSGSFDRPRSSSSGFESPRSSYTPSSSSSSPRSTTPSTSSSSSGGRVRN